MVVRTLSLEFRDLGHWLGNSSHSCLSVCLSRSCRADWGALCICKELHAGLVLILPSVAGRLSVKVGSPGLELQFCVTVRDADSTAGRLYSKWDSLDR